ncbi:TonB-dependent receptor [Pseudomonas sp. 21LCFQ010]|uniref:TonB-dependent siderophore receptor n=1 Tax=Pseudomonas sp. 21LCFQ010 TaxID=2957506 RepID=UPI0020976170|nr:TonB-dependent receptor [Pseudomonas sp. 21LCFQ010]MCO8164126.1 TonB-dependent receptor [Pseudomonas sp. 21LCFQ010]
MPASSLFRVALLARAIGAPALALSCIAVAPQSHAQQATQYYDVPAGPLSESLAAFAAKAGVTLPIDPVVTQNLRSDALKGEWTISQGFGQLLRGSGLEAVPQAGNTYTLRALPASGSALQLDATNISGWHSGSQAIGTVEGYSAARSATGTKTDTPLRDIPQSIQVVTRQVIEDQQITSLGDALSNVSSIQRGNTHGGTTESFFIRGFQNTTYAVDGMMTNSLVVRPEILSDLSNIERVEVLKGPASVLYGRGNPGGLINLVTRKPTYTPQGQLKAQVGSWDMRRLQAYLSGPLDSQHALAGGLAIATQTEGSFRDLYRDSHRRFIAPTLLWEPSELTRVEMGLEYTETDAQYDRGLLALNDKVDSRHKLFLEEPWSRAESDKTAAWVRIEHQANDWLTLRQVTRWDESSKHMLNVSQQSLQSDGRTTNRRATDFDESARSLSAQFEAIADFSLWGLQHQLLGGFETVNGRRQVRMLRANLAALDIFNPVHGAQPGPFSFGEDTRVRQNSYGLYLQDQIDLSEQWKLLLGVRWDKVEQRNRNYTATGSYSDINIEPSDTSPRAGIVYQPTDRLALYASYSTSFAPQNRLTRDGSVLDPETGEQYEIGARYELIPERMSATLSAFEIRRENLSTTDPADSNYSIQTGQQRVRGVELDVSGEISDGWNLIGNVAVLDAKLIKDTQLEEGNRLEGIPVLSGSLWSSYQLQSGPLQGLGIGAGVIYAGKRYGNLANNYSASGYARIDMSLFYDINEQLRVSLNARNVTDRDYIETVASAGNYAGEPASVTATLSMGF